MPRKQNAPGHRAEGVVCLHPHADTDAYNITAARVQFISRRCPIIRTHLGNPAELGLAA